MKILKWRLTAMLTNKVRIFMLGYTVGFFIGSFLMYMSIKA